MGPATIVGTLPEEKGTSGRAKTYIYRGRKKVCSSVTVILKILMMGIGWKHFDSFSESPSTIK